MQPSPNELNDRIIRCKRCPRLREYCREVARTKRRAYADERYWGKPVPNFGDSQADLLIVGLAPGAHGANRTGRMFTGDRSGDFLYAALHRAGFASQPESTAIDDGLELKNCAITAACNCSPPQNKPSRDEQTNCSTWLVETFAQANPKVVLCLGALAWNATFALLKESYRDKGARPKFEHGQVFNIADGLTIIGSYHVSQQNTFTGKLTEAMFDNVLAECRSFIESTRR
ncbi:uracil-DNA glycosylase [Stratiformator vulcanicus]|uniref:Type-5 uracil-DNA glycosylase n=1 Tax=Stratiformator vulcanicus TaxID=2527980 RepID=A0A517R021_9PLAN|nr:uracil-DNA glycosylase [Stratiformator vulcanicus]QDT37160.1 Uracil DNA glycosylase superfamily protein [Stratiformator vulcanicus]